MVRKTPAPKSAPAAVPARRDPYSLTVTPLTPDEIEYVVSVIPLTFRATDENMASVKRLRASLGEVVQAEPLLKTMKTEKKADRFAHPLTTPDTEPSFAEFAKTAFTITLQTALAEITDHLRKQLTGLSVCPLMLDPLREAVRYYYDHSKVEAGDTVGVLAAEALGGPVQQMALNSFHSSGTARNIAGGVDGIRELVNLSKQRSHPSNSIHFVKPVTFVEAIRKEAEIIGVTVGSLIKDTPMILATDQATPHEAWYELYALVYQVTPPPDAEWFLRLELDTTKLLTHRLVLNDVVRTIEKLVVVKCIASPTHLGIIDIYPIKRAILVALEVDAKKGKKGSSALLSAVMESEETSEEGTNETTVQEDEEEREERELEEKAMAAAVAESKKPAPAAAAAKKRTPRVDTVDPLQAQNVFHPSGASGDTQDYNTLMFLNTHIIPVLDKLLIKGVDRIQELFPVLTPIWSVVDGETYHEGVWTLHLNPRRMRRSGISFGELERLLTLTGQRFERIDDARYHVKGDAALRPGQKIIDAVTAQRAEYKKALKEEHNESSTVAGHTVARERFPLLDASDHIHCDTNGSNLRDLLKRRDVDPTRTTSNNVHEIAALFGIGAARAFLFEEFYSAISNAGSYVQPPHLMLLVDFMTARGHPLSVSFSALSKRDTHTLALATNQQSMKVFSNAAVMGKKEYVKGASAQILTNRRGEYGTGAVSVHFKPGEEEKWKAAQEAIAVAQAESDFAQQTEEFDAPARPNRLSRAAATRGRLTADEIRQSLGTAPTPATTSFVAQTALDDMFADEEAEPSVVPATAPAVQEPQSKRLTLEQAETIAVTQGIPLSLKPAAVVNPALQAIADSVRIPAIRLAPDAPDFPVPGELIEPVLPPSAPAPAPAARKKIRLGNVFASRPIDLEAALANPITLT